MFVLFLPYYKAKLFDCQYENDAVDDGDDNNSKTYLFPDFFRFFSQLFFLYLFS